MSRPRTDCIVLSDKFDQGLWLASCDESHLAVWLCASVPRLRMDLVSGALKIHKSYGRDNLSRHEGLGVTSQAGRMFVCLLTMVWQCGHPRLCATLRSCSLDPWNVSTDALEGRSSGLRRGTVVDLPPALKEAANPDLESCGCARRALGGDAQRLVGVCS